MLRKKELILLSCLRNNARETLTNISRQTKIPISTIFDKLREYEKQFIKKHTSLIDFRKLGYDLKIQLLIKLDLAKRKEFENFILKSQNVNNAYRINNKYDYFVEVIFKNIAEFQLFIDRLQSFNVLDMDEHFVVEDMKREDFLADRNFVEILM